MRTIVQSTRKFRSACRGHNQLTYFWKGKKHFTDTNFGSIYNPACSVEMGRYLHPSCMITRALLSNAAKASTVGSKAGPFVEYERRISEGELVDGDACQVGTLKELQRLYDELVEFANACQLDRYAASEKSARSCDWRKKRIHFHDFMLNVHSGLQRHKGVADPLEIVAGEISDEAILLCLDEFMVTDVADALILNRLFSHLFVNGVERCIVHEIGSAVDYRKMTSATQGFYFIGEESSSLLKEKFQDLVGKQIVGPQEVEVVMGRRLQVPLGFNGCAFFTFEELCDKPIGAADYIGLFRKFHTLALEDVPIFGLHNRTAAYRFVTLVDVMYENRARLLCAAEGTPHELFRRIVTVSDAQQIAPRTSSRSRKSDDSDLCVDNELGFAKDRTISRLTEMNSSEYLEQHAALFGMED